MIIAGILIAIYPPLLSIIVASVLILIGVTITMMGYRIKKMQKRFDDPFVDFFFRF
jgi:Flp pilus assembly protein TadB